MDERLVKFRVGVMVVATLIIAGILVFLFGELNWVVRTTFKTIYISFPTAPGIMVDTPVRKSGIRVGHVSNVELSDEYGVLVTAKIDEQFLIRRNEVAYIGVALLGDSVIEIIPSNDPTLPDEPIESGDVMVGVVASDPLQAIGNLQGDLTAAFESIAVTADEIAILARSLTDVVGNNEEQINRIVNDAELAVQDLRTGLNNFNSIVGDPQLQQDLRTTISRMPETLNELNTLITNMETTVASADRNLNNLEGFTRPLGERGPVLIDNIERVTSRLDTALADFSQFARALNDSQGTVGRLINDRELYDNLNATVRNVNEIVIDLQPILRDVRPIMNDVRVFTDKIARHPEIIGVRGAIQQSSGIK